MNISYALTVHCGYTFLIPGVQTMYMAGENISGLCTRMSILPDHLHCTLIKAMDVVYCLFEY